MSTGRKTKTFTANEKARRLSFRNLRKSNLAGVILGCTHATFEECLSEQLFGLPSSHYSYVKNIEPGLSLFLFNFSDRKLHGIFEATSKGKLAINSTAWTIDGSEKTPYAAQVKIQVRMRCQPLVEHMFRPIIADNYFKPRLFWFELDQAQTDKLISVFSSSPVVISSRKPQSGLGWLDSNDTNSIEERPLLSGSINNEAPKKWSSLFKEETCSGATEDPSVSEVNRGHLDTFNGEFDTRSVPDCWEDHIEDVEAPSNLEDVREYGEVASSKPNCGSSEMTEPSTSYLHLEVPRKEKSLELPKEDTSSKLYHYRSLFPGLPREIVPAHNHSEVPLETCSGATKEVEAPKKWTSLFKEETCSGATKDPSVSEVNRGHLDTFNGEFDTRSVPDCWEDHIEELEAPSNLEDVREYGEVASSKPNCGSSEMTEPSTPYLHLEVPRKEKSLELPKEDTSSKLYHYRSLFPGLPREIVPAHYHSEVPVETCSGATKEVEAPKKWTPLFKEETCSGATEDPSVSEVNRGNFDPFNGEFDTRSVPECWEDHIEDVEAPSNLEDVQEYGEVASSKPNCGSSEMTEPSTSYLHLEVPRKENSLELPKEDTSSKLYHYRSLFPCLPREIVPAHNHSEVPVASEMDSSSIHSIVAKLLLEVKELWLSQFKQTEKVNSLEQKLVESRVEIEQLKNKCSMLETGIVSRCLQEDDFEEEKFQLVTDQPHPACDASICLVGGFDGCSWLSSLDIYFPSRDKMKTCTTMSFSRSYTSAAKFSGELYILGGVDGNLWYDTVESYNLLKNQWTSHPPLNQKKRSFALLPLEDNMFVVGGGNGEECLSEVEMFLPNIGKWIPIRSLLHKRFAPAAAELHGILYVSGGFNGNTYLKSMERLDPREHARQELESMATKRGSHSLVVLNEKLYAIGGFDGTRMVSTVEVFDPRAGSWMMVDSMNNSRGCFGTVVVGDEIHVIGGLQDDKEVLDTVESYKDGKGWRVSKWDAIGKRCFFSAVLM